VYGGNLDLRLWLEAHGYSYVLAVACDEPVGIQTPEGRKRMTVAEAEALLLHSQDWHRLSMSCGTKGPRLFDWAVIPILHGWEDDGRHFLLIRRCLDDPSEEAYYFVFAPAGTTLFQMVKAIGQRWCIEECFETGKEMGMEDYEVRCWIAWYRHLTLVMIVMAALAGICAAARTSTAEPLSNGGTCLLLPLTIPAVRPCSSAGPGGGGAIRAVPVIFIRNVAVPPGKKRLSEPFLCCSAILGLFPGTIPGSCHSVPVVCRKEFFS
jgi:hypothetical protein